MKLFFLVFISLFVFSIQQCKELSIIMRSLSENASSQFYDNYVLPYCSSQSVKLMINLNNLSSKGNYAYVYAGYFPNPTKQNCTATTDTGAKVPLPNITITSNPNQPIYFSVRGIEGVRSSEYSISISRVTTDSPIDLQRITIPVETKASSKNTYCKACEEQRNVPKDLFLSYEQMIPGTVGLDETNCYRLPVCKTALPRGNAITLESFVTGRSPSFAFTQYVWNDTNVDSRHFFPRCLDDSQSTPSFLTCDGINGMKWDYASIPDNLYLGIEGWGGYYLSTQNDYYVTVAFTYLLNGRKIKFLKV